MASACTVAALAEARSGLVGWLDPGSSAQGWQSPFATETGGLSQTGNSVASAEQTSAALILSAVYSTFPRSFQKTGSRLVGRDDTVL